MKRQTLRNLLTELEYFFGEYKTVENVFTFENQDKKYKVSWRTENGIPEFVEIHRVIENEEKEKAVV